MSRMRGDPEYGLAIIEHPIVTLNDGGVVGAGGDCCAAGDCLPGGPVAPPISRIIMRGGIDARPCDVPSIVGCYNGKYTASPVWALTVTASVHSM